MTEPFKGAATSMSADDIEKQLRMGLSASREADDALMRDAADLLALHRIRARGEVLEEAARCAEAYAASNDLSYSDLVGMPAAQQVRYEGHKYAGQNIAAAIRALANSKPIEGDVK